MTELDLQVFEKVLDEHAVKARALAGLHVIPTQRATGQWYQPVAMAAEAADTMAELGKVSKKAKNTAGQ